MPSARKSKPATKTTTKASKKVTKEVAKEVAPVAEPVVVEATPVVTTPVVTTPEVVATEDTGLTSEFVDVLTQLSSMRSLITTLSTRVRTLQKGYERERKQALKAKKRRVKKSGNRAPSGFVKPTEISKELATFLGKSFGTEMARTEVTREINMYIREHKLQDPSNGRRILPDTKLRKLLRVPLSDELTYFNLQRYMSPHFAKATSKATSTASTATSTASTATSTASTTTA